MSSGHGIKRPRPAANFDGFWAKEDNKEGCSCALVLLDSVEIGMVISYGEDEEYDVNWLWLFLVCRRSSCPNLWSEPLGTLYSLQALLSNPQM